MVSNNVSKDRSFLQYLVLDILTNPDRVTLANTGNKANFALYILLFENLIKLASHNSVQKTDDKVGNNKRGKGGGKGSERERPKEIGKQSPNFGFAHA